MTTARLSPTANLLRNSKLFALPPTLSLPPARPSADPTASSDTATTLYPTRAALETPHSSLSVGDWGLKRALPLKSTTHTSTPTIRLSKDIDSEGHVADFESAADHVVTLKKWQNVDPHFVFKQRWSVGQIDKRISSVFKSNLDNTTIKKSDAQILSGSPSTVPEHLKRSLEQFELDQKAKAQSQGLDINDYERRTPNTPTTPTRHARWRYRGPWLAGMSNLEFDNFLKQVTSGPQLAEFCYFLSARQHLKALEKDVKDARIAFEEAGGRPGRALEPLPETDGDEHVAASDRSRWQAARAAQGRYKLATEKLANAREKQENGELIVEMKPKYENTVDAEGHDAVTREAEGPRMQLHQKYLNKFMRHNPKAFAQAIAEFLDLADGPDRPALTLMGGRADKDWQYRRDAAPTTQYRETGPPRTHPSAGFSYTRSMQYARNDPETGPSYPIHHLPGRVLKDTYVEGSRNAQQSIGVAGLIARPDTHGTRSLASAEKWRPKPGGLKTVVRLMDATVQQDGGIEMSVIGNNDYDLDEDNVPYNRQDWQRQMRNQRSMPKTSNRLDYLDQPESGRVQYRKAEPLKANVEDEGSGIMAALNATMNKSQ